MNKKVQKIIDECNKLDIEIEFKHRNKGYYYSIKNYNGKWIDSVATFDYLIEAALYIEKLIGIYFIK